MPLLTHSNPAGARVIEWLQEALKTENPPFPLKRFRLDPLHKVKNDAQFDENEDAFSLWLLWTDRINNLIKEEREEQSQQQSMPKENTIRGNIDDYLTLRRSFVGKKNTLGTYDTLRGHLDVFKKWNDPFAPITDINENLWEKYYLHLDGRVDTESQGKRVAVSAIKVCRTRQCEEGVVRKGKATPLDKQVQEFGVVAMFQRGEKVVRDPEKKPFVVVSVSRSKGTIFIAPEDNLEAKEEADPHEVTKDLIDGDWPPELTISSMQS